jgi:plastocyanin
MERINLWLLLTLLAGLAGCGGTGTRPEEAPVSHAGPDHPTGPRGERLQQITIDNFTFAPDTLTVPAGTKVLWVNRDDVPHTVTSSAKPAAFASPALDTDQTFAHVFTAPGAYPYYCAVHPKMVGRIVVE